MEKVDRINIQCPHCFKENDIYLPDKTNCKHCEEKFTGHNYISPVISGFSIFIIASMIGAGGTYGIKEHIEKTRYPIATEYSIIESCLSSDNTPLRTWQFANKKTTCQKALSKTQEKYSYQEFQDNMSGFLKEFKHNTTIRYK